MNNTLYQGIFINRKLSENDKLSAKSLHQAKKSSHKPVALFTFSFLAQIKKDSITIIIQWAVEVLIGGVCLYKVKLTFLSSFDKLTMSIWRSEPPEPQR